MRALALLPLLFLAACDQGPATNFSFNTHTESGNSVTARADGKTGAVAIDAPGFKATLNLPRLDLKSDNVDVSGVKLFPGSKITGMNVDAGDRDGRESGTVHIAFEAPAALGDVRAWFAGEMRKHRFRIRPDNEGLSGTTDEGDPVKLELGGAGSRTTGTLTVRDKE